MKGTSSVRRLRLRSFRTRLGSAYVFCKNACSCVRSSMRFLKLWLQIALEWLHECCMGYVVGRKPEHGNLVFFRVKWLEATMKGTSSVRRLRLRSFPDAIGSSYGFCKNLCSCVRSSMRFLQLWLQIALEWLHECCMDYVVGREAGARNLVFFPCKVAGGDDERYSAAVAPAVVPDAIGSSYGFCKNLCFLCA